MYQRLQSRTTHVEEEDGEEEEFKDINDILNK
jgi:hypothetical protein